MTETRNHCIVVCDDDPAVRRAVAFVLEAEEIGTIVIAENGEQGLARAKEHRPDLVLLDLRMPDLDGLSVCRAIRADPELAHTKVILLTGELIGNEGAVMGNIGADAWLHKPLSPRLLISTINDTLAPSSTPNEAPRDLGSSLAGRSTLP